MIHETVSLKFMVKGLQNDLKEKRNENKGRSMLHGPSLFLCRQ